jgi:hypothetical protein
VSRRNKDRDYLPRTFSLISAIAVAAIVIDIMVMITAVVMPMMMMVLTIVMSIRVMMNVAVTVIAVVSALAIVAHVVDPMAEEIVLSEHQLAAAVALVGDIASSVRSHCAHRRPQHGNSNRSQHDGKYQPGNKSLNFHKRFSSTLGSFRQCACNPIQHLQRAAEKRLPLVSRTVK